MIPTLLKLLLTINSDSKKQESYGAHNTTEETVIGNLIMVVGWYLFTFCKPRVPFSEGQQEGKEGMHFGTNRGK